MGNYSYFLEKRDERIEMQQATVAKAKNLLKTEIEWMRRMPQARSHKAKYRINAFYDLQDKASQKLNNDTINLSVKSSRLGKKMVELEHVSKSFPGVKLIENFTYKFSRFEKVGIIGNNGTGKSTFLNLITNTLQPDSGNIEIGQTIKFGYYRQDGIQFDNKERVIDAVTKIAEFITFEDGTKMSAAQMLNYFLFPPDTQYNYIEKLSGGEQRRLYLCTVLMENPNFLILDEPTNDLDIMTLNVLEEYLKSFAGCVIIVSHDRFFMDKIVDHLFVFEGDGKITNFPGNYTIYRNKQLEEQEKEKAEAKAEAEAKTEEKKQQAGKLQAKDESNSTQKRKLTFNEKREFESLENEIAKLEAEKEKLETAMNSGNLPHDELFKQSERLVTVKELIDEKELRWLELSELG
jgi:ATP-binding cassette subfamily F protein uup